MHTNPVKRSLVKHPRFGRGVAGRITLAGRSRCSRWMFKSDEKATPRPRFPPRTWGTLRVFPSRENCGVVNSDQLVSNQSLERPSRGYPPGATAQ